MQSINFLLWPNGLSLITWILTTLRVKTPLGGPCGQLIKDTNP